MSGAHTRPIRDTRVYWTVHPLESAGSGSRPPRRVHQLGREYKPFVKATPAKCSFVCEVGNPLSILNLDENEKPCL